MSSQLQVTGEAKIRDIQGPVVANSGVITALDGAASQYVRGDGTLADFPTSSGGGSSVSYYLNSSVSQGTIGGVAYRELSKDPIIGTGTDIAISSNGYVANYITDVNDPDVTIVPGGNFNCEFYFSVDSNSNNPTTYAELYKYDGTTFTLLGTSAGVPESINQGTTIAPYYFAIPVATASLALTDRLAIRIYVNVDGRTVTLHTENGHLCQVVTTLSKGMVSLNNLTDQSQFLTTGTAGTNFAIASTGDTHTFNLPVASATNTGKLSSTDWSTFNGKVPYTGATANVDLGNYSLTANGVTANSFNAIGSGVQGGYIYLKQGTTPYAYLLGSNGISADGTKFLLIANVDASNNKSALFELGSLANNTSRTYTLPDASGTLALTSNIPSLAGYVPYNGATQNVSLGSNVITAASFYSQAGIFLSIAGQATSGSGYATINGGTNYLDFRPANGGIFLFQFPYNTTRTFTLPDATGTVALTSNLSAYLPLAGGTLTGALSGTSATFTSGLINGTTDAFFDINRSASGNAGRVRFQTAGTDEFEIGLKGGVAGFHITKGDATELLTIASTGAATFSSSIAVGGAGLGLTGINMPNQNYLAWYQSGGSGAQQVAIRGNGTALELSSGGGLTMTLNGSGNVGIGTSSPLGGAKLHVMSINGTAYSSTPQLRISGGTNNNWAQILFSDDSLSDGKISYYAAASEADRMFSISARTTQSDFVIRGNGNVGIGTSSPMTFGGFTNLTIRSSSASNQAAIFLLNSTETIRGSWYSIGSTQVNFGTASNHPLVFDTNDTERMRITSGGVVLVNQTSLSAAGAGQKMQIATDMLTTGSLAGYFWENRSGGVTASANWYGWYATGGTIYLYNGAGNIASINTSNGAYTALSDINKKKDFEASTIGLDAILGLKPTLYRMKTDDENAQKQLGFIAQEVKEFIPQAYIQTKGEKEDFIGLDDRPIIAALVKAVQELKAEIEEVKALINK